MMRTFLIAQFFIAGISGWLSAQSFNPILANKLQNTIDIIRANNNVKGISACVVYPGMGTWKGVTGISYPGVPINSEMEFGIGSNTKLFTGVLILKLAENNLINLDDSLYQYLPPLKYVNPNITIRQLLNHTSGLDDVTNITGYPDSMLTNPNRIFTPGELLTWIGPPLFAPGTDWNYCNTNYLLAAMIAESRTGRTYAQLLRDSILKPLNLDSTFLDVYESVLYPVAHPWQGGVNNISIPRKSINSAAWAAGAMYSTSGEMAQWYHALMDGKVLHPNSLKEMTTFVGSGNYGIGISKAIINGRTVWQHGGTIWGGYNSSMMYDTASRVIVCVLINQLPAQAHQVAAQIISAIFNNATNLSENVEEKVLSIPYPNPCNDMVQLDIPEQELIEINVVSYAGQLMMKSTENRFLISDLPSGIYFLNIQTKHRNFNRKIYKP